MMDRELFLKQVKSNVKTLYRRSIDEASKQQLFQGVSYAIKDDIINDWIATQKQIDKQDAKTVYYMSMEFLIGRLLGNNLVNMGAYDDAREALRTIGVDLNAVEDQEPDPALGNGGLGRLAACFLDSLSTLGYPAYGCGIRYHYGMFKQKIENGYQKEVPDEWIKNRYPFEIRRDEYETEVRFGGTIREENDPKTGRTHFVQENYASVMAVPYDLPVVGYGNHVVNTLRIWDAHAKTEFSLDDFDKGDYRKAVEQEYLARTISEVLYPNDSHYVGKELRLKQQYFFVSASLQTIIKKYKRKHRDLSGLPDKVVIQMNDTHPTITVPELMRLLVDEERLTWDEAWDIVSRTCAYTNHTIMSEALEKWPIDLFEKLLPRVYQIVQEIDKRFKEKIRAAFPGDEEKVKRMAILYDGQVRMANMAICASFSVNGVARLHTEILKKETLRDFYDLEPYKFNNKTNGITQRRFLLHGNERLATWVSSLIGPEWVTDLSQMEKLNAFVDDEDKQKEFAAIKRANKERLAAYILKHNHIEVDPDSIFDVQVKRLHEYKRQLLNILHIIYLYDQIKRNPQMRFIPHTFIFGAKAAAGYVRAKETIKLINSVAEVINNDPTIGGKMKVVFIEDYRVSNAEIIFAAADVSEQISTASKEASGTGNMKMMLNGAVTLGTMDGANVEIVEQVGEDNAFIFGLSSDEVINYENNGGYDPMQLYMSDPDIRFVLDRLVDGTFAHGDTETYRDLYQSLLYGKEHEAADPYFILKDFKAYDEARRRMREAYADRPAWVKMAMKQVAHVGMFSSDRTILEYINDIWHVDKLDPIEGEEER